MSNNGDKRSATSSRQVLIAYLRRGVASVIVFASSIIISRILVEYNIPHSEQYGSVRNALIVSYLLLFMYGDTYESVPLWKAAIMALTVSFISNAVVYIV